MKIVIVAGGSRGDVQPYVALGGGLRRAGHAVTILSTDDFRALAEEQGLELVATGSNVEEHAQERMAKLLERGNLLEILSSTGRGAEELAELTARAGAEACRGADLVLAGLGGVFTALALAQTSGARLAQAYLVPLTPTGAFPSALAPLPAGVPAWANRLSHRATRQMIWQMFRAADARARREVLGLPPTPLLGPPAAQLADARPVLYGYSRHVIPPPADWGAGIHVTGYWTLDPPAGWRPPADLLAFLESGPPPVYIGFGSMASARPEEAGRLALDALARTGQRGLLYAGWGGLRPDQLPPGVFMTGSVPHSWLFPRMAAVVHHGGAGTTGAGLRAGVPSVVTPFFGDQPFWGRRVAELGVGPAPVARQRLTAESLASAIDRAVGDPEMRRRAAALGERIRAEDGVASAVAAIEGLGAR